MAEIFYHSSDHILLEYDKSASAQYGYRTFLFSYMLNIIYNNQIIYFNQKYICIQIKTYICHPIPPSSGRLYSRPSPVCNAGSEQNLVALKRTSRINMIKVYS